jgi:transposase-like protein
MRRPNSLAPHFTNESKARAFLEAARWPNGPICPHCGAAGKTYKLTPRTKSRKGSHVRPGLRKCGQCRREFTVTVGTIFESSRIPLHKWLYAYRLVCTSRKGVSARRLHQVLDITYKSAWFMACRIRYTIALINEAQQESPRDTFSGEMPIAQAS